MRLTRRFVPEGPNNIDQPRLLIDGGSDDGASQLADALVANGSPRKLRGGYYTPAPIAAFLTNWAIRRKDARVLEPSAGDGAIVAAIVGRLGSMGKIVAIELDGSEAKSVRARGGANTTVIQGDFFAWYERHRPDATFDAVVGNPPFIRYQDFPEEQRGSAFKLMVEEGLRASRLTNAWLPFVVAATRALRPNGRLALVLPAELLQVGYAAQLREYLAWKYVRLIVITFRQLSFFGIQQETVLLLGVRGDDVARVSFMEMDSIDDLLDADVEGLHPVPVDLDHLREKWTQYYLTSRELGLVRELERAATFRRLGDFASVDVGVVTGENQFFVLTADEADRRGLRQWCVPLVGRSAQIPGLLLRTEDWEQLLHEGSRCLLLQLGAARRQDLSSTALAYVEQGERLGIHQGYKCAIRLPAWWNVPSIWSPDAFLLRQIHDAPRIIRNRAGAVSTDTIHRVRAAPGVDSDWLAAASVNSLTLAFSEIRGRSYGGGVLELEPTEAEGLPFPTPKPSRPFLDVDDLDARYRREGLESLLAEVDRLTLRVSGLGDAEVAILRDIWRKLYERRLQRKRR